MTALSLEELVQCPPSRRPDFLDPLDGILDRQALEVEGSKIFLHVKLVCCVLKEGAERVLSLSLSSQHQRAADQSQGTDIR